MTGPPFNLGDKVRLKHFPAAYFTVDAVSAAPEDQSGLYSGRTGLNKPLSAFGCDLELVPEPEPVGETYPKGAVLGFRTGSDERFTVQEYEVLPLSRGGVYSGTSTSRDALLWAYGDSVVLCSSEPPVPPLTPARIAEALAHAGEYDGFRIETADYASGQGRRAVSGVDAAGRRFVAYVNVSNLKYLS